MNRSDPKYHENLFRPITELKSSYSYTAAAVWLSFQQGYSIAGGINVLHGLSLLATGCAARKMIQAYPMLKKQYSLYNNKMVVIPIEKLRKINIKPNADEKLISIGEGFEWGAEHANRAHQIDDMSSTLGEVKVPVLLKLVKAFKANNTKKLGGKPWIHGLGESLPMMANEEAFYGHTFICGNVGTGKTTLFKLLSLGMMHIAKSKNEKTLLIIIDPKNDSDWRGSLSRECKEMNLPFHYFNPSRPSESVKIDPLKNYSRITDIPDRLAGLLSSEQGSNAFIDFGYESIFKVVSAMEYVNERPRITTIKNYLTEHKADLLYKALSKYYETQFGMAWKQDNWAHMIKSTGSKSNAKELEVMVSYYSAIMRQENQCDALEGILTLNTHNQEHYQKMVTSLLPLFSNLTAEPLNELLSPVDDLSLRDKRKIVDTKSLSDTGGVLYIATGSMSDAKTSSNLAKLLLSDITANAGATYDHQDGKGLRVSLFVDEAHAVLGGNDSIINLLAQGRAANYQVFLSTQTIADVEAKTDSATKDRILGLCNNFFSMRVTDMSTQEYVSNQLGLKSITNQQITVNHSSGTEGNISEFSGGYAERLNQVKDSAFPPHLLGQLPKLEYMCRLSDGRISKGKIPVVKRVG